jgi:hypothetical protein
MGLVLEDNEGIGSAPGGHPDPAQLEQMKVVELRALARRIAGFPIKGRDVARAGRDELLGAFRSLGS